MLGSAAVRGVVGQACGVSSPSLTRFAAGLTKFLAHSLTSLTRFNVATTGVATLISLRGTFRIVAPSCICITVISRGILSGGGGQTILRSVLNGVHIETIGAFNRSDPICGRFGFAHIGAASSTACLSQYHSVTTATRGCLARLTTFNRARTRVSTFVTRYSDFRATRHTVTSTISSQLANAHLEVRGNGRLCKFITACYSLNGTTFNGAGCTGCRSCVVCSGTSAPRATPRTPRGIGFRGSIIS